MAPVWHTLSVTDGIEPQLLHTGQHYDRGLSDTFVEQLDLGAPTFHLEVGSGTHAEQTAAVMLRVEPALTRELRRPAHAG